MSKGTMKRDGDFMSKPEEGWSHNTAALAVGNGVYYSFPVRYIGSIQVLESMRDLPMNDKSAVCWEAIARCCDAAALRKVKKRKVSKTVKKFLADTPYVKVMELKINLSVEGIATSDLASNEIISNDEIKKISFAAGGQQSEYDFVTYVAKDKRDNRYCHVFDCSILADDVLATIGQIFSILTNQADEDMSNDTAQLAALGGPGEKPIDNPLYQAVLGGVLQGGGSIKPQQRKSSAAINAAYDEADQGGDPTYDTAGVESAYDTAGGESAYDTAAGGGLYDDVDEEKGAQFAEFLNENVASQPLYGEVGPGGADGSAIYGDGAEPGWGYLDVKPDEDLYGGLADVFVDE